jgi:myo-inositol 2-dehydrogenase / D-chiro-inositol 1-dehydrogenase
MTDATKQPPVPPAPGPGTPDFPPLAPPVRVAVLGAGRMGLTHLRTLAAIRDARVMVVADTDPEAAERGRQVAGAPRAVTDPLEAIADPEVDAVVIVTSTSTHAALIEASVRAGHAVWSEKPIALDLAETRRVVDVIAETGRPVQLGFMRRYDPGYVAAKARIDAGEVGRIEVFRALGRDTYPPSVEFLRTSGGLFLDMAVHDLDLARFLVGEVEEVQAWGANLLDDRFREAGDIDTAVTLLRFRDGALGVVETARHSPWGYDIRTEVAGSLGKVVVDAPQRTPMLFSRRFGFEGDHHDNFPDRFEVAFRLELEAFIEALVEGRTPEPGPQEALETLRLAIAVTRSWREGRPVRVDEVTG